MRYFDNGCFFTVTVSENEVYEWKRHFPCSGLPDLPISFQFDARNGDLVDLHCRKDTATFDGPALVALSQDAYQYGLTRRARYVPKG